MKRYLEPVDVMVAIGLFATVCSGALLFLSTEGALQAATPEPAPVAQRTDLMEAMEWVQPALGQAIVDDYLLEWHVNRSAADAVTDLNRATLVDHRLHNPPFGYLDRVRAIASQIETDHAALVQFVMGRTVVSFTTRGVRSGLVSGDRLGGAYNRRAIAIAEGIGDRMDARFYADWQHRLGQLIVSASLSQIRLTEQSQQRIGQAIVQLSTIQDRYLAAKEALQEQLASVALASIHTEQIADRFEQLAAADLRPAEAAAPVSEPKVWPEVPGEYLFAACAALVGIFFAGLFMPGFRPEAEEAVPGRRVETAETVYRKTA